MHDGTLVLLIVLIAGILGQNDLVAIAAAAMLALQVAGTPTVFLFLDRFTVQLGVIFLLIGLMIPFATGRMGLSSVSSSLMSIHGVVAVVVGILFAYLAADGVELLTARPDVMIGIVVGSIAGVAWFGGVPAGPLVAAGLISLVYRLLDR